MTKKRVRQVTKPYNFLYKDGSYITYDLCKDDFEEVEAIMFGSERVAKVSFGILELSDVRSIVEMKEPEAKPVEDTKPADPILSFAELQWLKEQEEFMRQFREEDAN